MRGFPLTFERLRRKNVKRNRQSFKGNLEDWSLAEWSNAMAGECGEACNLTKKMLRGDRGGPESHRRGLGSPGRLRPAPDPLRGSSPGIGLLPRGGDPEAPGPRPPPRLRCGAVGRLCAGLPDAGAAVGGRSRSRDPRRAPARLSPPRSPRPGAGAPEARGRNGSSIRRLNQGESDGRLAGPVSPERQR